MILDGQVRKGPNERVHSFIQKVRKRIAQFGLWIGALLLVCSFVLAELHLIDSPYINILVLAGLMVILSEQVQDVGQSLVEHQTEGSGKLASVDKRLGELISNVKTSVLTPRVRRFWDCMDDFRERLKRVRSEQKLVIEHFGLDMEHAWDEMTTALSHASNLRHIEYRLLMMDGPTHPLPSDEGYSNSSLEGWRIKAGHQYRHIMDTLDDVINEFVKQSCTLDITIKKYGGDPVVHGVRILEPRSIAVAYIGVCRWKGREWQEADWGQNSYQIVDAESESETCCDIRDVFESHFQHHFYAAEDSGIPKSPK
jgi:hypothetical protein